MQPDCTIEPLTLRAGQFRELQSLRPSDLFQFPLRLGRQMLVNGHEVISLAPRFRKASCQKLVEGLQILQAPVLPRPHLAQVSSEFHKPGIALCLPPPLPCQNLIDLGEPEQGPLAIQLGQHWRIPTKQARQANQVVLLLAAAPERLRPNPAVPGRARCRGSCCTDSAGIEYRCAAGTERTRSAEWRLLPAG